MVHLLSLALRILTFTEFIVRQSLAEKNLALAGLYSGNPKRETFSPTSERLLAAFDSITLSIVSLPNQTLYYISPLSELQKLILPLLHLPFSIYESIPNEFRPLATPF